MREYQFDPFPLLGPKRIWPRDEMVGNCREFIRRFDEDDILIYALLSSYDGTFDEFLSLRRSVWPDSHFYHLDFSWKRMQIAVAMACEYSVAPAAPAMCRSVLGLDNGTAQNNLNFRVRTQFSKTFFHGLATKIVRTNEGENLGGWRTLTRDVLRHLADIRDLSQHRDEQRVWKSCSPLLTPLLMLIEVGIKEQPAPLGLHRAIRSTRSAAILSRCEKSIFAWLSDLYEGGIDLMLYGTNEKEHFRDPKCLPTGLAILYSRPPRFSDTVYRVRLINFQYGRLPTDWKFWWTEPSDRFAGDFWRLVESASRRAAMSVPGAWVD